MVARAGSRKAIRNAGHTAQLRPAAGLLRALAIVAVCASVTRVHAQARPHAPRDGVSPPQAPDSASVSRGLPWDGELRGGVRLQESDSLRYVSQYEGGGNFYGTQELVGLLQRTGEAVAKQFPGSRLSIGELSAREGGWIDGHRSHRNGRDVDIAFFMRNDAGKFTSFWRFVAFERNGPSDPEDAGLRFDDARNWAAISQLLRDPGARIQYIFVSKPVRARLLVEGRQQGESEDFLRAAAAVMVEPQHGHKHENHFHVRIFCPQDDRPACEDSSPYWPWFQGVSPEGFYTELPKIRWRSSQPGREPSAPTVLPTVPSPPTALAPDAPADATPGPSRPTKGRAGDRMAHSESQTAAQGANPG